MKFQTILPLAALAASSLAHAESYAPIGELSIDTALVRAGAKPVLSWNISYPSSTVEDVITIENDDAIITDQKVRMDIRLLGASFSMDGRTPSPVNFQVKVGSAGWQNTFTGTENDIVPSNVMLSAEVAAGTEVNFAGAGQTGSSSWTNSRNTLSDNLNVIALKDGDTVPSYTPAFANQGEIADHVSAYIQDGKIAIGPRDVIYLIELYSSDPDSRYFDMQDLVVLATFDEVNTTALTTTSTQTTTTTTTNTSSDGTQSTTTTTHRRSRR